MLVGATGPPDAGAAPVTNAASAKRAQWDLDAFCRDQYGRILGMLGLYCGDRDLAEELTQETLARACRDWPRLASSDGAERWLARVAFNLAKSSFRSRAARRRVIERYGPFLEDVTVDRDPASVLAVRAAVAALPERQRRAVILRYFADLPIAEVGLVMRCPQGTVKTLTFQAIAQLRRAGLEVDDA
jgi:RNA polymerase sigma-70 factor (ECF subfamily)